MAVELMSDAELARRQTDGVKKYLQYLVPNKVQLKVAREVGKGAVILYAHDGDLGGQSHADSFFLSVNRHYECQYHELWRLSKSRFLLDQAYLSVYRRASRDGSARVEMICLHIDPLEPDHSPHCRTKRSPHFHICAASDPLPKLHIATDLFGQKEMLKSLEGVSARMILAIKLLRRELLDRDLPEEERLKHL